VRLIMRCNYDVATTRMTKATKKERSSNNASELQAALQLQHRCIAALLQSQQAGQKSMLTTPRNKKSLNFKLDSKYATLLRTDR